jgi:hypothetical protein
MADFSKITEALRVPAVESAAVGTAGALLFRALAHFGVNALQGEGVDADYRNRVKTAATVLGALTGGITPFIRDADYSSPSSFFSSMTHRASSDTFDITPFLGNIGVNDSVRYIHEDAFLHPYEKETAISVISQAPQLTRDKTSSYNLVRSAIRAGIGFVPAYSFGVLAGKALGLPSETVSHLSRIGALAYAVRASGLSEQL